jgi:hypothetical protein
VSTISFLPTPPNSSVTVQANGEAVAFGKSTKSFAIGNSPDTAWIRVTDQSTGVSATREYRIAMIPTPPPGLLLASLVPSTGRLNVDFTPENTIYILYMPPTEDDVSFRATPLDPRTMTMTIDGEAAFPDVPSTPITVARGTSKTIAIYVSRPGEKGYYQVTLDHTQTSSH